KGPDDRKLVLSGLAAIAHPAALEATEPFLKDAATRNEAELATLAVARAIMGSAPAEAKSAAARLAKSKNAAVRKQAAGILATMDRLGGYITAWQVAGPYEQRGKDGAALIDVAFAPEKADAKGVAWKPLPVNAASKTPWMLDLFSGPDRACYVRTWVHSAKAQKARVELGDDDGSKIWLNGKVVHASAPGGVATPGEHKIPIALLAGWNPVLMKVTQYSGPWQFCFRIRAADGDEMDGIRVQAMPPEK
ncbi:hypothetical protein HQ560_21615, partial [bacterium]|nr:hypothetical protein [bacterium]